MTDVAMLLTGFSRLIVTVGALVVSVGALYLVAKLGAATTADYSFRGGDARSPILFRIDLAK